MIPNSQYRRGPLDDGHGGPRLAEIKSTIAVDGTYYVLVYGEAGATSFHITATVAAGPAAPKPPPDNCVTGLIQEVHLDANADVTETVIGGKRVGPGSRISLPASPQLRAALQVGRSVSACYNGSGQIDEITLKSQ